MIVVVTGSSGLIGSEAVAHFDAQGHEIVGIDPAWGITRSLPDILREMVAR